MLPDASKTPRRHFPGGLRVQLIVSMLLLLVVTMSMIAVAVLQVTKRQLMDQARAQTNSHTGLLAALAPAQLHEDRDAYLSRYAQHAGVDFAAWLTPENILFTSHDGVLRELCVEHLDSHPGSPTHWQVARRDGETYLLESRRTAEGMVVVAMDMKEVQGALAFARESTIIFITLNAVLLVILGYAIFTFGVIRPLRALGVATERAAQGDFASPVTRIPRNELGVLTTQFNQMLIRLDDQREQLQRQLVELEQAYTDLQDTQRSLIRSEKLASIGQLAAGVAHEVGNPLAAVFGYAELLADGGMDDEMSQDIGKRIMKQVDRMRSIIRELLDFSRDDSSEPAQPTPIGPAIEEAIHLAKTTRPAKYMKFTTTIPEDAADAIAVHSRLVQVFLNLVMNAADALDEAKIKDPTITITATQTDSALEIRVHDNGPGVPEEHITRLFDPFFTTKEPGKGTGLGLSICHKIVESFGGDIYLDESSPGATFVLTLRTNHA